MRSIFASWISSPPRRLAALFRRRGVRRALRSSALGSTSSSRRLPRRQSRVCICVRSSCASSSASRAVLPATTRSTPSDSASNLRLGSVDLIPERSLQRSRALDEERGGVGPARVTVRVSSRAAVTKPPPRSSSRSRAPAGASRRVRRGEVLLRLRPRLARLSRADPRGLGLRRGFVGASSRARSSRRRSFCLRGDALQPLLWPACSPP